MSQRAPIGQKTADLVTRCEVELDTTTLAVPDISAGTYLGFKLPGVTKGAEKNP